MAFGLLLRDAAGVAGLTVTDRITRYIGTFPWTISVGSSSTTIPLPGAEPTSWFAWVTANFCAAQVVTDGITISTAVAVTSSPLSGVATVFRG
jgi:hypothetical protein